MSKYLFDPRNVPAYPQITAATEQDLNSDTIVTPNHYVMRSRVVTGSGVAGPWGVIQMPQYVTDPSPASVTAESGKVFPWAASPLKGQKATLDVGTYSAFTSGSSYVNYVSAVNINLLENFRYATSGVKVWFRWMPAAMFTSGTLPVTNAFGDTQKTGSTYTPADWQLVGVYNASSFTTAIPRNADTSTDKYFQILVTDNTTTKPDKFNYRWMGTADVTITALPPHNSNKWGKIGEPWYYSSTYQYGGYLPWNPYYAATQSASPWDDVNYSYMRQRTTMQDIALFYPRRWTA